MKAALPIWSGLYAFGSNCELENSCMCLTIDQSTNQGKPFLTAVRVSILIGLPAHFEKAPINQSFYGSVAISGADAVVHLAACPDDADTNGPHENASDPSAQHADASDANASDAVDANAPGGVDQHRPSAHGRREVWHAGAKRHE